MASLEGWSFTTKLRPRYGDSELYLAFSAIVVDKIDKAYTLHAIRYLQSGSDTLEIFAVSKVEGWRSGQSHLTVNQAPSGYVGSNPAPSTIYL
jgi:hypothetical protein